MDAIKIAVDGLYDGNLQSFLQDSVVAFLHRNGGGTGKHPETKFFINTYLCSESALDYLRHHTSDIRHLYRSITSSETFEGLVRAEIMAGEIQYLEGPISLDLPDPSSLRPSVWWMIACMLMKRLSRADIMPEWLHGSGQSLAEGGKRIPKDALLHHEETRIRAEKRLRNRVVELATEGIEEATYGWLQQHRLITIFRGESGELDMAGDEAFIEAVRPFIRPDANTTLKHRDSNLRKVVAARLESQGKVIHKHIRTNVEEDTPQRVYPQLELIKGWFSPGAQKKVTDTVET